MQRYPTALFLAGLAAFAATAQAADCVQVPRGVEDPPVRACETSTTYELDITGDHYSYDKRLYRDALRRSLRAWLRGSPLERATGSVEIWLAVPDANPSATRMRAFVRTARGNFVASLSLHPESLEPGAQGWQVTSADVGVLGSAAYPASYGVRAGSILAKSTAAASPADVEALFARHGGSAPELFAPRWWSLTVLPFDEAASVQRALADPDAAAVVERAEPNAVVEWIALREKAFAFSLGAP